MLDDLRKYTKRHGINVRVFKTHWEANKSDAPYVRDRKIINYVDAVIAIWDYKSPDIRNLVGLSLAENKPTHVHII